VSCCSRVFVFGSLEVGVLYNKLYCFADLFILCSVDSAGNFKPFMRFNLSWLTYLVYAIIWVTILAPIIEDRHK